jgi:hypothetical protein
MTVHDDGGNHRAVRKPGRIGPDDAPGRKRGQR